MIDLQWFVVILGSVQFSGRPLFRDILESWKRNK